MYYCVAIHQTFHSSDLVLSNGDNSRISKLRIRNNRLFVRLGEYVTVNYDVLSAKSAEEVTTDRSITR